MSDAKRDLIRRYLVASGLQARIDAGRFVERHGWIGRPVFESAMAEGHSIGEAAAAASAALQAAYARHRSVWQAQYEAHVDHAFGEADLAVIVAFLESAAGRLYLDWNGRMDAYIETNTEELVEEIVATAHAAVTPR
jgi:hypothetical protein